MRTNNFNTGMNIISVRKNNLFSNNINTNNIKTNNG
jgi:hypothetical protein